MLHHFLSNIHDNATPSRARWSSVALLGWFLGVMPVTLGAQAAPTAPAQTQAQLDSIKQRLDDAEAALQALREQLATEASTALRTRTRVSLEFTGRALMHIVQNDRRTNNVDVPLIVRPDSGTGPQGGLAMTIRQTTLGLAFTVTEVLGGTFKGDIDADFYGGQQPSSGGRTFPLVRLRTARGQVDWANGFVMAGQEQPLISGLDPVSLASVGVPGFTTAGNLWLWLPQVRGGVHTGGRVRFGIEAAVLAPTSGDPAGLFDTQFDAAERTGTPYVEGLLRLDWGGEDQRGTLTAGYHSGRVSDASDTPRNSAVVAATWQVPLGSRIEFRGEAYRGTLARGLGGGAIGQAFGLNGTPIRTDAFWSQLNVRATPRVLFGAGFGSDTPRDTDLLPAQRQRNQTTEAHLHWRPAGPVVIGFEWRQLATRYAAGTEKARHLNLALGFEF